MALVLVSVQRDPESALLSKRHKAFVELSLSVSWIDFGKMLGIKPGRDELQVHDPEATVPDAMHPPLLHRANVPETGPLHDLFQTGSSFIRIHVYAKHQAPPARQ